MTAFKLFIAVQVFVYTAVFGAKLEEVTMGFNPAENTDAVEMNTRAFADYFQKKLGIKLKVFIPTDYTALVEAMRSGKVAFAWLPPFSFLKAEKLAGGRVMLKAVRKGYAVYYSAIITRADKGFKSVTDLKGKSMAWVDPASVSGHLLPKANLITRKIVPDPDKFFGKQVFAGAHDTLVLSVLNGTVDAGATFTNDPKGEDGAWTLYLKTPEERKQIKPIFISDPIPGDTLATTEKFYSEHKDVVENTSKMLQQMGADPEGKKILMALYRIESMVPAKSKDYDPVRAAAKTLKIEE